ncbi:MAG: hypothetical protein WCA10_05025 [Terracidiphilus sp.]
MTEPEEKKSRIEPAQWWVVAFVVAAICGSVLYRYLMGMRYLHSAAMFIGVPAVLAVVLALTPRTKTVTGGIVKGITLALLVIAPLLGEGYLCILMAAPLFYVVGLLIGIPVDIAKRKARRGETLSCMVILLLPLCLEGVVPQLTPSRGQTVEVTKIVDSPASRVEEALAESPRDRHALAGIPEDRISPSAGCERTRARCWSATSNSVFRRGGRSGGLAGNADRGASTGVRALRNSKRWQQADAVDSLECVGGGVDACGCESHARDVADSL